MKKYLANFRFKKHRVENSIANQKAKRLIFLFIGLLFLGIITYGTLIHQEGFIAYVNLYPLLIAFPIVLYLVTSFYVFSLFRAIISSIIAAIIFCFAGLIMVFNLVLFAVLLEYAFD